MQTYRDFQPTGFDARGIGADEHSIGTFGVLLSRSRDSGPLELSNFTVALESLGGESDSVQVHRFGHWACGWFELLLVDPADETRFADAQAMHDCLQDYPVLSDEHYSNVCYEMAAEQWQRESVAERVRIIQRYGRQEKVSIFSARSDELPQGLYADEWYADEWIEAN